MGAFHGTALELILRTQGIGRLLLAGVATDMVVDSTAREAHDRDFAVVIAADCCIAASAEDQQRSLTTLQKIAQVIDSKEFIL